MIIILYRVGKIVGSFYKHLKMKFLHIYSIMHSASNNLFNFSFPFCHALESITNHQSLNCYVYNSFHSEGENLMNCMYSVHRSRT